MVEFINLLLVLIPYASSVPLSLYIGSILENIKNYHYYNKKVIQKKKNDDIDIKKEENIKNEGINEENKLNTSNTSKYVPSDSPNNSHNCKFDINTIKENENKNSNKIPKSYKDCLSFKNVNLSQPSKYYIYYTRFCLYFIILINVVIITKCVIPELLEIFSLNFWIPSKLSLKNSLIGFIISVIFGHPWLDNPYLQMYTLNRYLRNQNNYNERSCYFKNKFKSCKTSKKGVIEEDCNTKMNNDLPPRKISLSLPYKKAYLSWNPTLHFNSKVKAFIIDISRLICSCMLIPVMEELVFRYIFYRFIIGGFNYKLVSFSTWRWTAAILSNIVITHVFYIRCYEKSEEWITGLINGYLCTYSMIKQGRWNASVNTHCLTNLFIGLYVLITKKYKYWS